MQADEAGTSWFVLSEAGKYRFWCEGGSVEVVARCFAVQAPAGYGHVQRVRLEL